MSEMALGKKMALKKTQRKILSAAWSVVRFVLIAGIGYYILYPLITKFSMCFMSMEDLSDVTVRLIPRHFTTENLRMVWKVMEYPSALLRTLGLSLLVTFAQLFSCVLIGYGFARFSFPLKRFWFALVLLTLLVPPQVITIPLYMRFNYFDIGNIFQLLTGRSLNLINSIWPSVLLACTGLGIRNGLFIYIIRQYFRNMPKELEEASLIDGAGVFRTFFKIMLPSARPILTSVFLFSFVWQWNDILYASWFMPSASILSINLNNLVYNFILHLRTTGQLMSDQIDVSQQALINGIGCLLVILPLFILYMIAQKAFVESIERSGLVG